MIGSQIYRKWDAPYYKVGNTVCISILSLAVIAIFVQRQWLIKLNKKKRQQWDELTSEQQMAYQMDTEAREKEGNKRIDFRFAL